MKQVLIITLLTFFAFAAKAQKPDTVKTKSVNDSLTRVRDSVASKPVLPKILAKKNKKKYNPDSTHSPGLAFRRSGFVPGWGQIYNHRWWKVPLIYAGLGSLGLALEFNSRYYKQYLKVYQMRRNGDRPDAETSKTITDLYVNTQNANLTQLEGAVNGYQRNFQLSILGVMGAWGIQMIDAYIDAKFIHSYTMDRDLSFKVTPGIMPTGPIYAAGAMPSVMPVIKLTFTMK
ncbi:DUF5683 domain-containing protein [Mucilaginibacter sp. PAMB04274]|uniref:DUF5683 domain-containing protein n=1 Tax=Mucilaginibacter sp. PAMB04274 TaxID=3138568 RepID=UPI0031F6C6D4